MNLVEKSCELLANKKNDSCQECTCATPVEVVELINALGGANNILSFNNSVSQLRYGLKNVSLINEAELKKLGAKKVEVFDASNYVQVTFDCGVDQLNEVVKLYVPNLKEETTDNAQATKEETSSVKQEAQCVEQFDVLAPVSGELVALEKLNDGIFSEKLVGNGVAILVSGSTAKVLAPFDGKIMMMPANKNQIIFKSHEGIEVVIVAGLNSYKLDGIGIDAKFNLNDNVKKQEVLLELNLNKFDQENIDKHIIITTTNDSVLQNVTSMADKALAGEVLFKLCK
ncbi:PTS glucose transporter subunit IIABC [Mycoplasma sp. NEAQ87857]|uniref:PTS glucose transporter subunit IIA n=1 Tax=Mycoplasma sp. NEAQ87857 TaxID=2683967 RepID=UPI0013168F5E|nr:PTS glucose transporter subunit IIA [Mycoplasma sp. NEAQ87857]QGZ97560.1 PTS glucose transporter subunit IIABC [Mycoplasma sp. NEAQ87857]